MTSEARHYWVGHPPGGRYPPERIGDLGSAWIDRQVDEWMDEWMPDLLFNLSTATTLHIANHGMRSFKSVSPKSKTTIHLTNMFSLTSLHLDVPTKLHLQWPHKSLDTQPFLHYFYWRPLGIGLSKVPHVQSFSLPGLQKWVRIMVLDSPFVCSWNGKNQPHSSATFSASQQICAPSVQLRTFSVVPLAKSFCKHTF